MLEVIVERLLDTEYVNTMPLGDLWALCPCESLELNIMRNKIPIAPTLLRHRNGIV